MIEEAPRTRTQGAPRALDGIRVIESATMVAAPVAGMMLADHGADVIKVELPEAGDSLRNWGYRKNGVPLYWKVVARNKRSITLDLRKPAGKELFLKLIATADVYLENFRPGTLDKWGLSAEVLREAKPDLVIARVSGYGHTGPYSRRPGFGTLAEAMSGFAYTNGWPDRPPTLPSFSLADASAGFATAYGILAALRHRDRTGEGQDVDVALYEPLMTLLGSPITDYDQNGYVQERNGNAIPFVAPRNAYQTSDSRWVALSCSTQATARRLFEAIGMPALLEDPRFATNQDRIKNVAALDEMIAAWFAARSYDDAMKALETHGVTAGPIYSSAELFNDPHVRERGSIVQIHDEDLGDVWMQAPVPRLTGTPGRIDFGGKREAGQDNAEVYAEFPELSESALAELRSQGVI